MRMGTGEPKIFSDRVIIPTMIKRGIAPEDARNYVIVGCVELSVPGKEYGWHDSAYFSIARVLEMALNDGYALGHEALGRLGPATGRLEDFEAFEDLQQAYEAQMAYWVEVQARSTDIMDVVHRELKPLPYLSLLVEGCTEQGRDIDTGAAPYNFTGPQAVGVGTVADSLAVIKQLVFEDRKVSAAELMEAMKADWQGFDPLYHLVNGDKVHHYGNDDDYADDLARYAPTCIARRSRDDRTRAAASTSRACTPSPPTCRSAWSRQPHRTAGRRTSRCQTASGRCTPRRLA